MKTMKRFFTMLIPLFLAYSASAQVEIGDKVDNFTLKNIDGTEVSLSDFNDEKGVILVFTCNTCPFAIKYEERIMGLHQKFADEGYPVVAVNPNDPGVKPGDSFEAMKERAMEKGYDFPYLRDEDQKLASYYGAERTPEIFLLENKDGSFYLKYTGTIDNNVDNPDAADEHYVTAAVNDLQAGKDVAVKETKAVGCTIKWGN